MLFAILLLATISIESPMPLRAPANVASTWTSFGDLSPAPAQGEVAFNTDAATPASAARADVLRREGREWVWMATAAYEPGFVLPRTGFDRGVLVRFNGSPVYLWGEIPAGSSSPVTLRALRNVRVSGVGEDEIVSFHGGEREPRTAGLRQTILRGIPVGETLLCAIGATSSRCRLVDAAADAVDLEGATSGDVRVLRAERQDGDEIRVVARGNVEVRPKEIAATVIRAGGWTAIALPHGPRWEDVVVDRSGSELAVQRLEGSSLAPLPAFSDVFAASERGVAIRAWIGEEKRPLTDSDAMLLLFPHRDSGLSPQIPLLTAAPDQDGVFQLPALGSGTYQLKLLSSLAKADRVKVRVTAGIPLDVVFPSGPAVTGRVVRTTGGDPTEAVFVEASIMTTLQEATKGDLTDKVRFTNANDNGDFTIVLGAPGRYRLRVRWGSASAEREFEIQEKTREVQLGEIPLRAGTTLRGTVAGCGGGEAVIIPVPDFSKPLAIGMKELRRGAIDPAGAFVVEGLTAGEWSILLQCDGVAVTAAPETFPVAEQGDTIIQFERRAAIATP